MNRREMLLTTGAMLALGRRPRAWAAPGKKRKLLYFTKCSGFIHGVVKRQGEALAFSERLMIKLGKQHGIEVVCSKDGTLFDKDLDQWDAMMFYTSGDLTKPGNDKQPPMSPKGKQALLDWVRAGNGFLGIHAGNDSFHTPGPRNRNQDKPDPYIAMVGGEFISHGPQQEATVRLVDPKFPGCAKTPKAWRMREEWYAHKNFAPDLHVILVMETKGMKGGQYQRPPFPSTWARMHGKGRVFYTSFGHREDVWTNSLVQGLLLGGLRWAFGDAEADVTPNIKQVTPKASVLG